MIHREISDIKFQVDSLDGLRGFAALLVLFSHASYLGMTAFPGLDLRGIEKSGVYLFFLLSSFLLTMPLLRKGKEILTIPVMSHYWQRRFFRIYPLYTVYLLAAVFSSWGYSFFGGITKAGIPFSLDLQGFASHLLLQQGKSVTWSIAVEFKFYFVLPFFVFAITYIQNYGQRVTIFFFLCFFILSQLIFPQQQTLTNDIRLLPYLPIFYF